MLNQIATDTDRYAEAKELFELLERPLHELSQHEPPDPLFSNLIKTNFKFCKKIDIPIYPDEKDFKLPSKRDISNWAYIALHARNPETRILAFIAIENLKLAKEFFTTDTATVTTVKYNSTVLYSLLKTDD